MTDTIASLQSQLNALTHRGSGGGDNDAGTGNGGGGKFGGGDGNSTGFPTLTNIRYQFYFNVEPERKVYDNNNYWHTHGYHIADNHTSATCKNKKERHQTSATRTNIMGGCTRGASVCL